MAKKWMKMAMPFSFGSLASSSTDRSPSRSGSSTSSTTTEPLCQSVSQPIFTPSQASAHTHRRDSQLAYLSSLPNDGYGSPTGDISGNHTPHTPGFEAHSVSSSTPSEPSSSYTSFTFDLPVNRRQSEISVQTDGDLVQGLSPAEVDFLKQECQKAVTNAEDALKCIICLSKTRDTLFSPCHHLVTCEGCSRLLTTQSGSSYRSCPLCRKSITKLTKIYLS